MTNPTIDPISYNAGIEAAAKMKTKRVAVRITQNLLALVMQAENEANRLKLFKAARALNRAKNAIGWEAAEHLGDAADLMIKHDAEFERAVRKAHRVAR